MAAELGTNRSHPRGTGFKGMMGSCRTAEAWHCESPGEAISEREDSVAVELPGLKGSCREAEVWHH